VAAGAYAHRAERRRCQLCGRITDYCKGDDVATALRWEWVLASYRVTLPWEYEAVISDSLRPVPDASPEAPQSNFRCGHCDVAEHRRFRVLSAVESAERGSKRLGLDCWRTNSKLHDYYLRRGFKRVRTEVVPGRMSGEPFQFDPLHSGTVETYPELGLV
jgi:hypothetical protein